MMEKNGFGGPLQASFYELILEAEVQEGMDRVTFFANLNAGQKTFITEIRLHPQDVFVCYRWGFFLLNSGGLGDVAFKEHTYVDNAYFTDDDKIEMEIFYQSDMRFVVNHAVVTQGIRMDKFERFEHVYNRVNSGNDGLQDVPGGECFVLMGTKNLHFFMDLPRKTRLKSSGRRLRLRLAGLLFKNANIIS